MWSSYVAVAKTKPEGSALSAEDTAQCKKWHRILNESQFYDVYPAYFLESQKLYRNLAGTPDDICTDIGNAATKYFEEQRKKQGAADDGFYCVWNKRPSNLGGTRHGVIAEVQMPCDKDPIAYNIKAHHFYKTDKKSGLKEMFCYKLLELLGVGPEAKFIPAADSVVKLYVNKSEFFFLIISIIFFSLRNIFRCIATKWNNGFKPFKILKEAEINKEAEVQMLLLRTVLCITDLHHSNRGRLYTKKEQQKEIGQSICSDF